MTPIDVTDEERRAIASLKRLAKKWPKSLWLFSASGTLTVMRRAWDGEPSFCGKGGTADKRYIVDVIRGIDNDGGDW